MANAAAKKAAAAKAATANIYQPLLIGSNLIYIFLMLSLNQQWTVWNVLSIFITWGLQAFSYIGILDRAKNTANVTASSLSMPSSCNSRKKDLVGGAHLDLLCLTVVIQYVTVLHSTKWFHLLWLVPMGGGWILYTTFFGGGGGNRKGVGSGSVPKDESLDLAADREKREKRAQKRRQKWG